MSKTIPQTATRTDHSITIRVGSKIIGMIQDWNPSQARTITPSYEINAASPGVVYENIPGIATGLTISVTRIDLFKSRMEHAWGKDFNITMLTDQHNPLSIMEWWDNPGGIYRDGGNIEVWIYDGVFFSSLGRSHSANGDRIVRANVSLVYKRRYQIASSKARAMTDPIDAIKNSKKYFMQDMKETIGGVKNTFKNDSIF